MRAFSDWFQTFKNMFAKYLLSSVECWCLVDEVEAVMSSVISAWLSRSDGPIKVD